MTRMNVDLGPVQETLLLPLFGRAQETSRGLGLLDDPKAVEMVARLDYDFSRWDGLKTLRGLTIRTRMFDDHVRTFLERHPEGTVVEIGAGLNTRFERLDNGRAHWVELDLPDTMALRRQFFTETDRRTLIAASALDTDWFATVQERPGPFCFVSEAVLIYLDTPDAERAVQQIAAAFPGAVLVMDTAVTELVEDQAQHEAMNKLSEASWFRWRCDDPADLARLGLHLTSSQTVLDASDAIKAKLPLSSRLTMRFLPWLLRRKVERYRLNRFELGPAL